MESVGEASERPALSRRIYNTRKRLQDQWDADHPGEPDNPFTQEEVARRVGPNGVTLGGYGAWERYREPNMKRLRQIATALYLDEDYFLPNGDLAAATARVEAEAERFSSLTGQVETLLGALRAHLEEAGVDLPPVERDA